MACTTPPLIALFYRIFPTPRNDMRRYYVLVDLGYGHFRVDHSRDEFTKGTVHINGIKGFWGLAKIRLAKFMGRSSSGK